jgi:quercetin dioxygenase-like cupin family protein
VTKVDKPWGYELIWARTGAYVGKVLFIRKGHKLSLQYHRVKEETILLHSGEMIFTTEVDGSLVEKRLGAGASHHIPPGMKHRMEAVEDCTVFEVSTPHLDDVVRLEDAYGRVG